MPNNKRKITPIYADDPYWSGQDTTGSLANPLNADRYGRGLFQGKYIQGGEGSYYGQGASSMDKRVRQSPYTQGTTMEVPGYVEDKRHPYDAPEYNREFYRAQDRKPVIEDTPISDFFFSKAVAADVIEEAPMTSSRAQVVDPNKIYTYSELVNTPGAIYQRGSAVKEVERRLGRKLSKGEATLVSDEGFVTVPYRDGAKTAIGMGQQDKYYTPDNILQGFELAIKDKKKQMQAKFGDAYPIDEKGEWALINLAYRGDVQPGWSKKFIAGDIKGAEKEFWNNNSYRELLAKEKQGKPTALLNRLRRNAKDLFGFSSK